MPFRAVIVQCGARPGPLVIMLLVVRFSTPTGLVGRGVGLLTAEGPAPAVTAVLLTPRDSRADWLRAGQALHRLLLHAVQ